MSDTSTFGGSFGGTADPTAGPVSVGGAPLPGAGPAPQAQAPQQPAQTGVFGSGLAVGGFGQPKYTPPPAGASPLDTSIDLTQQQIGNATNAATNPLANFFDPEGAAKKRAEIPQLTEQLLKLKQQKQQQTDLQSQARNFGMPSSQINPNMTGDTIDNYLLDQYKKGDPNAFKALQARGKNEWVTDYSGDFIQAQHSNMTTANNAVTSLNAAGDNQAAYKSALNSLNPKDRTALENVMRQEGLPGGIPDTAAKWSAMSAQHGAKFAQMRQFIDQHVRQLNNMTNFDQGMPKEAADSIAAGITLGSTSEPAFDGKSAKVRSQDGQPGVVGPNGSVRTDKFGLSPSQGGWNASSAERLEKSDKMLAGEDVKGAINQYNIANKFLHEAMNDANYTSSAGLALLKDTLGGVGRDVAEKSAAAGTTGLSQMFSKQQGGFEGWMNTAQGELGAYQNWINKGKKGDAPRISDETKRGLQAIAQENYKFAKEQGTGRLTGAMRYAGQIGRPLEDIPLDKDLKAEVSRYHEEGRIDAINGFNSYPSLVRGNQRVYFQQGSNVNGAQGPRAPMAFPDPNQPIAPAPAGASGNPPAGSAPPSSGPAGGPNSPRPGGPGGGPGGPGGGPGGPGGGPNPQGGPGAPGGGPGGGPNPQDGPAPVAPSGGPTPGRYGVPPGMQLNTPQALDAAANRTIQIESGFRPGQQTGSYKGYGQWSDDEMRRHGITDPNDLGQTQAALKADIQTRAAKLQKDGLPVTASNVYLMHQQGEAGLEAHLSNPQGKAWENIAHFYKAPAIAKQAVWGNMTPEMKRQFPGGVDTVTSGDFTRLWQARYDGTDNGAPDPKNPNAPRSGGASVEAVLGRRTGLAGHGRTAPRADEQPDQGGGFWSRVSRVFSQGIPEGQKDQAVADVGNAAVEHAPAIGSTLGAVGGTVVGGTPGGMAGGGAGGGAGQALKDYMQGRPQDPAAIAKETALGTAFGVLPGSRLVGPLVRAAGAGGIEGGAEALKGGDAGDITDAAVKGAGSALGGELFGRALGMAGHKVFSMFAPDAQKTVQAAAKDFHEVTKTLETETPKLPGVGGAAGTANPKYEAAEAAKTKAETVLKDAGLKPEEAAYAHKVSSEGVPKREADAARPGALEEQAVGKGYQQLENEVGDKGVGAPKGRDVPLPDGPMTAVVNKQVPARFSELAERVETEIRKPAASWQEKWTQLKDARSDLLEAERTAKASTGDRKGETAKAYRVLADTVRVQQEKVAGLVFGPQDGKAFMGRLKVLDTRYRNLMEATNGGDLAEAARLTGEKGREADKKFRAFAHDDKVALAAWNAMRKKGGNVEKDVLDQIRIEKVPYVGALVGAGRYMLGLRKWAQDRAAGSPATFADFMKQSMTPDTTGRTVRDLAGTAAQRGATM